MSRDRESNSEGMSGAAKVICVAIGIGAVCAGVGLTNGILWDYTYDAEGKWIGVEYLDSTERAHANARELPVLPPNGLLPDQLKAIGTSNPWCGPKTLPIPNAESDDSRVCIEENNLVLSGTHIVAFMRTDPRIEQTEGNPSLYLTYEQPSFLTKCIDNKEAMRSAMQEDLTALLGASAASYTIEIHVDGRNLAHPCDDPIVTG